MSLQEKETLELAQAKMQEYLQDNAVCSMDEYVQHGTTSTLQHCLSVVRISCAIAVGLHIRVNYENLILGALLHDFYLYDWHNHVDEGVLHGFAHPHIACKNAAMRFHVNAEVQHIITTHMWPLTLRFAMYSQRTIKTDAENLKLSYFEVPILAQYYVTPDLSIEVGPSITGSLSSSPDKMKFNSVLISTGELKGFDVMLTAGVSYKLKVSNKHENCLTASLRYNLGMSKLAGNFDGKVNTVTVSVGWLFSLVK